jgi:hypothetical protein
MDGGAFLEDEYPVLLGVSGQNHKVGMLALSPWRQISILEVIT